MTEAEFYGKAISLADPDLQEKIKVILNLPN